MQTTTPRQRPLSANAKQQEQKQQQQQRLQQDEIKKANGQCSYSMANAVKHCEKLPTKSLDSSTTVCTTASVVSSLNALVPNWNVWSFSAIVCGGLAFFTNTTSTNKQFEEVNLKLDLSRLENKLLGLKAERSDLKAERSGLEIRILIFEVRLGTSHDQDQIAKAASEITILENEITKVNKAIKKVEEQITTLERQLATQESKSTPLEVGGTQDENNSITPAALYLPLA